MRNLLPLMLSVSDNTIPNKLQKREKIEKEENIMTKIIDTNVKEKMLKAEIKRQRRLLRNIKNNKV